MRSLITCDKCKIIEHMKIESADPRGDGGSVWVAPEEWNSLGGVDLCPKCSKLFSEWLGKNPNVLGWK